MDDCTARVALVGEDSRNAMVSDYYDQMQRFYGRLWHPSAVHYGLWEADVRTHDEAVRRMDEHVGSRLGLADGSQVVDAGCGIGGTCFALARRHRHRMIGLTLSPDQLARAVARRAAFRDGPTPDFLVRSYMRTGFADGSIDGVYGIESICYAEPRRSFFDEAFRILRPGGRLVVADGFVGRRSPSIDRDIQIFCTGVAVTSLCSVEQFVADAEAAGFRDVDVTDLTALVEASAVRIHRLCRFGMMMVGIAGFLMEAPPQWYSHCHAGLVQLGLVRSGGMRYYSMAATKPLA
jgi:tocopherol O-methyltransferase